MSAGEKPVQIVTGIQNSATAITRGMLLIHNDVADEQKVVPSTANAAKPAGVALDASPGQNKAFPRVKAGLVKVKAGGACTQGAFCESDANGAAIDATAGAGRNVFGRFVESGVANDLVMLEVYCQRITV